MAARGINKAIIVGNLGKDPEMRYLPNGDAVANLTVATSETWKDKQTGEQKEVVMSVHKRDSWREDNPDWLRDYSDPSTMPGVGEVGEWQDKLVNKKPGGGLVLSLFKI